MAEMLDCKDTMKHVAVLFVFDSQDFDQTYDCTSKVIRDLFLIEFLVSRYLLLDAGYFNGSGMLLACIARLVGPELLLELWRSTTWWYQNNQCDNESKSFFVYNSNSTSKVTEISIDFMNFFITDHSRLDYLTLFVWQRYLLWSGRSSKRRERLKSQTQGKSKVPTTYLSTYLCNYLCMFDWPSSDRFSRFNESTVCAVRCQWTDGSQSHTHHVRHYSNYNYSVVTLMQCHGVSIFWAKTEYTYRSYYALSLNNFKFSLIVKCNFTPIYYSEFLDA